MKNINETIRSLMENVAGLRAAIVIDSDGIPIAMEGDIEMEPQDLGALLASAFQCYQALGDSLSQCYCKLVCAEYDSLNVAQQMMPRGSLILIADKSLPMGVVRLTANTGRQILTEAMETTAEARKKFMEKHKISLPKNPGNDDPTQTISLLSFLEKKKKG